MKKSIAKTDNNSKVLLFDDDTEFFKVSNDVIDIALPKLTPKAFALLMLFIRKTRGYQKEADALPMSQLEKLTGMSTDTVVSGIRELLGITADNTKVGLPLIKRLDGSRGVSAVYALNNDVEVSANTLKKHNGLVKDKKVAPEFGVVKPQKPRPETGASIEKFAPVSGLHARPETGLYKRQEEKKEKERKEVFESSESFQEVEQEVVLYDPFPLAGTRRIIEEGENIYYKLPKERRTQLTEQGKVIVTQQLDSHFLYKRMLMEQGECEHNAAVYAKNKYPHLHRDEVIYLLARESRQGIKKQQPRNDSTI